MVGALVLFGLLSTPGDDAVPCLEQAYTAWADGRIHATIASLECAVDIDPQNVDALAALAYLSFESGHIARSIDYLRRLLEHDPNNDAARLLLARAWYGLGRLHRGDEALNVVLERHPTLEAALELRAERRRELSPFAVRARVGVAGVYDSNLSLDPGTLDGVSNRGAGLLELEAAVGVSYGKAWVPLTITAWYDGYTPLARAEELSTLAPTTVGAGLEGALSIGTLVNRMSLRYEELFADSFGLHLQRTVMPSTSVGLPFGEHHWLRAFVGGEFRFPEPEFGPGLSSTLRVLLRDRIVAGRWTLVVDVGGRLNTGAETAPGEWRRTNFLEADTGIHTELMVTETCVLVAAGIAQARHFDNGPDEYTFGGNGGVRLDVGGAELHAGYDFSTNRSIDQRTFIRHRVMAGVRVFYN